VSEVGEGASGEDIAPRNPWLLWALLPIALLSFVHMASRQSRLDPALLIPLLPLLVVSLVVLAMRPFRLTVLALACVPAFVGSFAIAWLFAGQLPLFQSAVLAICCVAAYLAGIGLVWLIRCRNTAGWTLACIALAVSIAIGWFVIASNMVERGYALRALTQPLQVATMTSLPFGFGEADIAAVLQQRTEPPAIIAAVRPVMQLNLIDAPTPAALRHADLLLLAHPRAMSAEALVAIDAWVRAGGQALVLADPISEWSIRHPIGDPRNGPYLSLLMPLLRHWGLTLEADENDSAATQHFFVDIRDSNYQLSLDGTGRFASALPTCQVRADRRIADCRIGRGRALIIADADFLASEHWEAHWDDGYGPPAGDTPQWLADRAMALARSERFAAKHAPWFRPVRARP
jgi:hypothetical protein